MEHTPKPRILSLPGWQDSSPAHWQTLWQQRYGDEKVDQSDWQWPRRGDWMARLEETVLARPEPVVFVAHSLGCQLVAAWAAHTRHAHRVQAALLVAPPDTERLDCPPQLHNWRPMPRRRLPFAALALLSSNDPYGSLDQCLPLMGQWAVPSRILGDLGHLNGDSGLGDWPAGRELLHQLLNSLVHSPPAISDNSPHG